MKKSVAIILIACAILSLFIVSCENNPVCYTVTVKDGEKTIDTQIVNEGAEYTLPAAPNTRGKVFSGWQSSGGGSNLKAGAKVKVTTDLTFTAVWGDTIDAPDISAISTTNVYKATETITLTELTEGTTYRWTLDGSEPTATTTNTGKEIALSGTAGIVTVKIAIEKEGCLSETATLTLKVEPTITFDKQEDSTADTTESIKIQVPTGTTVYYTTNGDEPTTSSSEYNSTTGISLADLTGSTTIKVLAIKDEVEAKDQITIKVQLPGPTVNVNTTTIYAQTDKVTIEVPTGAEVRYTFDGSEPTATTGTVYDATTGISLKGNSGNVIIKAATYKNGEACSAVSTITIKVQPTTPEYLPEDYPYYATAKISSYSTYDADTKIYYTTDGTNPTTSSAESTDGKIPLAGLSGKVTIKVIAVKDDIVSQVTDFEVKVKPTISFGDTADGADVGQDEKLTISASAGASVYYTTDGTDPKTSSTKVEGKEIDFATIGAGSKTIRVYAIKDEVEATQKLTVIVKPASPATGADGDEEGKLYTQTDTIAVTVSSTATCYYTLDGSDPTDTTNANRKTYDATSKIALTGQSGEVTIRAIVVDGGQTSKEKRLTVKVQPTVTLDKTANVELEATEAIAVAVLDTANTKIYYTVDGTEPVVDTTGNPTGTTASTTDGKIPLTNLAGNVIVKVLAIKDNIKSNVTTLAIKVKLEVSFDAAAEAELEQTGSITITVPNGSTVYYTTDGTDPTTATTTTGNTISLTGLVGKVNIKVLAVKDGVTSGVKELSVKVKPTISFDYNANADVRQDQKVTVTVAPGVNVYYTTDDTTPTTSSTKAADGKIDLSSVSTGSTTIKILAEKDGVTATSQLAINVKLALPVVSANETTTYTQADSITIAIPSETDIYYTLDGTDPANASNINRKKYSTGISLDGLSGEVVLKVVVVKGSETSEEKSLTLKIQPKKPTYTGATKNAYATSETLVFDAPSDAELYFTFDGSDPATSSTRIKATDGKSIPLAASLNGAETGNITVKVVSIKDNVVSEETTLNLYVSSKVVTLTYVLDGGTITATSYETNAPKGSNTSITLLTASDVTKTGYAFDGWYTDATPSTSNYAGTSVTLNNDNVTLYAHWVDAQIKYTESGAVELNNGITASGDIVISSVYHGKTITTIKDFSVAPNISSVTIPSTITTIDCDSGAFAQCTSLKTVTFEGNSVVSIPSETFEGCNALEKIIFKVNKSTVTLDCSASSIKNWMGTSTTTPTIIYGDTHTVTVYNTDDSVLVATYYVDADVTVTKPTVEPTGIASDKIFKYWTADGTNEFVFGKTITENIKLRPYVKVRERLTLTYELNGGNTSESCTVSIMEGEDYSEITLLTEDKVSKQGYIFDGWYTKNPEDSTVTAAELAASYISTSTFNLAKNTTIYAHWLDEKLDYDDSSDTVSVEKDNYDITGDVVIPNVYHGKLVTEIEYAAFGDGDGIKITSITIPDTVEKIGDYAFAWSTLSKVEFTGNCKITEIPNRAFFKCSSLTEINIPSSVTTIAGKAFAQTSLTSLTIPSSVTTIGNTSSESIIDSCTSLETITFEEGSKISTVYDNAFANCASLKTIIFKSNDADVAVAHTEADIDKWTGSMSPRPTVVFNDTHKITYLNEDGSVFSTQYVASTTTKIPETPVITAEGKIFAYWSIDGTTEYVFGQTISEDIVLKPAVKDGIALTYVLNGGKITATDFVTQADESTPIPVLTASDVSRDGYTFDGWYTKNPEDTAVPAADVVASYYSDSTVTLTKSVILYANWVTDKLTYTDNSGTISVKAKDASTLTGDVVIPCVYQGKLVTAIEQAAFAGGEDDYCQIKSVVIPDTVETIGSAAFRSTTLEKVEFTGESKIKEIPSATFIYCQNLTEINIPQSVETIGYRAFSSCYALTSDILAGTKVVTIGEYAFWGANITKITIPYTVTSIGKAAFKSCSDLVTVVFAKSEEGKTAQITAIADETFSECNDLTAIEIPATVTSIGNQVFHNTILTSFTFEEGSVIQSIGSQLFTNSGNYCKFTTISIPGTIKSISSDAFYQCNYLTSIYVDRDEPVEGDTDYATLVGTMTWSSSATITWKDSVAVTINYNNGSASTVKNIKKGTSITKPSDPTYTGHDFVTWTTEDGVEYDFSSTITEPTTIVAKWATAYEVGDVGPAGGYIIYVNPYYDATSTSNNWKYLEVSEEDLTKDGATKFAFGGSGIVIGGNATALAIGVGDSNTKAIVDALGTSGNYAAFVCSNYSVEKDGKTYTGWYLPNSGELSLVYSLKTKYTLDTTWTNGRYWSSTEDNTATSTNAATFVDFSTGSKAYENNNKTVEYAVRAIRKVKVGE